MKRDALRTESDTSHRVTSLGFSRCRRRKRISMGMPPYCRLLRIVRRESSRPFSSWRWRIASASLILRASRATTAFIWATSSGDSAKSGLSVRTSRVSRSPCPVGAALQLPLHVLADHLAEGLEAQVEVVADAREHPGVHPLGLEHLHDAGEVALDRLPVELVVDAPREVAGLEKVHEALEPGRLAALADRHLHVAALAAEHQLGQLVHLEALFGREPVEHLLDARVLRAEGLLEAAAEGLEVEEVQVEDPVEGRVVARLLDERGGERGLERLAALEPDLRRGGERVERLAGRDAQLGPPKIADELERCAGP